MKMLRLLQIGMLICGVLSNVTFLGCGSGGGNNNDIDDCIGCDQPVNCEYSGSGDWPEYSGHWESILNATGDKHNDRAYLDIMINNDGTFSGTYQSYIYDYTWMMNTHMGTFPIPVYNPDGNIKDVCGVIDFDEHQGSVSFEGRGEVSFELNIISSDEWALEFPYDFSYSLANIQY